MLVASCATSVKFANDVRLIGFEDNVRRGKNIGLIEGDDCNFGFSLFGKSGSVGSTNIRRAFDSARSGERSSVSGQVGRTFGGESGRRGAAAGGLRYMNNVTVTTDSSNYILFSKDCQVVSGKGHS
jgi:hypothetical protein